MAFRASDFDVRSLNTPAYGHPAENNYSTETSRTIEHNRRHTPAGSLMSYYTNQDARIESASTVSDAWQFDRDLSLPPFPNWHNLADTVSSSADQMSTTTEDEKATFRSKSPEPVPLFHIQGPPRQTLVPADQQDRASLGGNAWWVRSILSGKPLPWEVEEKVQATALPVITRRGSSRVSQLNGFPFHEPIKGTTIDVVGGELCKPIIPTRYNHRTLANTKQHLLQIQRDRERFHLQQQQRQRQRDSSWHSTMKQAHSTMKDAKLPALPEVAESPSLKERNSWSPLIQQDPVYQARIQQLDEDTRRKKRDQLVILFALGFLFPALWFVAGFFWSKQLEDAEDRLPLGAKHFNIGIWRIANRGMACASLILLFAIIMIAVILHS
ncbi:hypothetical protein BCR37DRAFT_392446 [Protomyces lactucae-debilis]|uniref:Uncharacterized protein n=1 Tax=Protomyces lactucae-debilis TaxID=2754530 RepID=A0A1Y2FIK9_PROLT|nr:uncharacterized protein BCR37DRAFT_392446 [Protomyces lactucae-debilis]ORY83086.1 hypothetical protein BCR37DRAFT_392446 [Protomyces lactucae-debilis]